MNTPIRFFIISLLLWACITNSFAQDARLKPVNKSQSGYRLSGTDITKQILWGATCELPDGTGLLFGGQDQNSFDGSPHTQIKKDGAWVSIEKELKDKNPLQKFYSDTWSLRNRQKDLIAKYRLIYLNGLSPDATAKLVSDKCFAEHENIIKDLIKTISEIKEANKNLTKYEVAQINCAIAYYEEAKINITSNLNTIKAGLNNKQIGDLRLAQIVLEKASEALNAEPPARNLSPIVYDTKNKLFVLFGGDHQDYLTNDTWVFDLTEKKWMQRHPKIAPLPRTNHLLKSSDDGKITLSEGCTYALELGHYEFQYIDMKDGDWIYDVTSDSWSGKDGVSPDIRTYRIPSYLPEYYLEDPKPDAAKHEVFLKNIPVNTWVDLKPSKMPPSNRDWGTVTIDPDHDMLLRWAGGHSGYSGTDILQYHLSTNRWEVTFPPENPMGETASAGPGTTGVNFNQRPSISGHTYKSYGYDLVSKKLLFVGRAHAYGRPPEQQDVNFYIYDPEKGDWAEKYPKLASMFYLECYYTLVICPTPLATYVWSKNGEILKYEASKKEWIPIKLTGIPLPGTTVDGACLNYDSKKNRLIAIRTPGYEKKYDGDVYEIDLQSFAVNKLSPKGMNSLAEMDFIREAAYDAENNVMLIATPISVNGPKAGLFPIYDCSKNQWLGVKIEGPELFKGGKNVSIGLTYDNKRNLYWLVDSRANVFALKLDLKAAKPIELE